MVGYDENGFSPSGEDSGRKCPECGEEVNGKFRFCPACGTAIPVPEVPAQEPLHPSTAVPRQEPPSRGQSIPRRGARFAVNGNEPEPGRRFRPNADRTEASFREFNAVARPRRRRGNRKSTLPLIFALLLFLASIGGGVYWFLRQGEDLPLDAVEWEPEKTSSAPGPAPEEPSPAGTRTAENPEGTAEVPGETVQPAGPTASTPVPFASAVPGEIPEVTLPTRGIVIGSSVNLRTSHTIESPVAGRVSAGNRLEVLESWTPDDSAEAVTLSDVELTAPDGKKVKVARGRGVTVTGLPDASGMVKVILPEDRNKVVYSVSSSSLSDPQAWPWYRVKPQGGGKEGWIFGKFLTVLDTREESLSVLYLERVLTSYGTTKEQIQEVLGKPQKTSARKVKTSEGEGTETTLTFSGGTFVVYEGPGGPEVKKIILTSAKYPLDGGLAVGMERRQVLSLLGHPNDLVKGEEIYRASKTTGIRIKYGNYRVKSVTAGVLN
ncbi:zinc-ribbon domain-containing protein [Aminivibrio sp.]|uniref:zinc-ribbon domain-containing protein n=1 Tax=Aminivibrio sp. TaxID=1872489 RepID=UPI001A5C42E0|nr:zinc-ribbon domain-containing protein [Aminivibrio sp.]MBL3539546.1 hypothetical protein [Aminivibrio sp.]MDK2958448.1 Double zinc ribbon [Synergistaceae bacterium]